MALRKIRWKRGRLPIGRFGEANSANAEIGAPGAGGRKWWQATARRQRGGKDDLSHCWFTLKQLRRIGQFFAWRCGRCFELM